MNKERLKTICEKVLEINKEAKEYVAIFADGPDFCSDKEMEYFIFKDGNGQDELMSLTYNDYKLCDKAGIIDENSYDGFKHRYIYDFIIQNVEDKLKELNEEIEEITKKCPKCGSTEFFVYPHVIQKWRVNKYGEFIKQEKYCNGVSLKADEDDEWECANCGYKADGWIFEN